MPAAAFNLESVPGILGNCLEQSQKTISNHRKNINIVYKLFQQCARVVKRSADSGKIKSFTGEAAFVTALKENGINRVLVLKRGIVEADRVIKFICGFITHAIAESEARQQEGEQGESSDSAVSETPISRLFAHILKHLLKGFIAKDKNVRFRSVQFVALLLNDFNELDGTVYETLLEALVVRVKDKEASIRVQAVFAIAKLQNSNEWKDLVKYGEEGCEYEDEDEDTPTTILLKMMRYDPSAEVRRAAMFQLDLNEKSITYILSRTRDIDPINRRAIYAQIFESIESMAALSAEHRLIIAKNGLRDREENVKKSAARLLARWAGATPGGLLEFLGLFDVLHETSVAENAISSVIENRQDLAMALQFPEAYWADLSPESALLAKAYITYCKSVNDDARLEECLPVITALAFRLQESHAIMMALHDQQQQVDKDLGRDATLEADVENTCFVTRQLLEIALLADYGDEIGRRKMFTLIRDMVSDSRLPADLIPACMDVLLKLSSGERDFARVIVEVVQNVREDASNLDRAASAFPSEAEEEEDDDDLDLETATAEDIAEAHQRKLEKAAKKMQNRQLDPEKKDTYLRCLLLARALLERVVGQTLLQDHETINGLVHELIVPSVKCKIEELRQHGLICLGLCTLLDRSMACDSFGLFIHQSQDTEGDLQAKVYQIVFDNLLLYGLSFLEDRGHGPDVVVEFLLHALNQDSQQVQAIAAVGIAKLMLSGMLTDAEVLKRLVLVYFAPETVDNLELRQCLSYFFPVYCYSLAANQKKMQEIFIPTFDILAGVYEEIDDPSMMVSPTQLANQLLDWTDPRKAVSIEGLVVDHAIHAELAQDILKKLYVERKKDSRKLFCQLLNKLYLPQDLDEWTIKKIMLLIEQLDMHRPIKDRVAKNALTKFTDSLNKAYEEATRPMTEDEFRTFDQLHAVVDFLDAIKQENEERGDENHAGDDSVLTNSTAARRRKGSSTPRTLSSKKSSARRSRSISETPSVDDSDDDSTPAPAPAPGSERRSARQPKTVARKPQPILEEDEEEEESSEEEQEEEANSESESEEEEEEEAPPPPPVQTKKKTAPKGRRAPQPVDEDSDEATDDTL